GQTRGPRQGGPARPGSTRGGWWCPNRRRAARPLPSVDPEAVARKPADSGVDLEERTGAGLCVPIQRRGCDEDAIQRGTRECEAGDAGRRQLYLPDQPSLRRKTADAPTVPVGDPEMALAVHSHAIGNAPRFRKGQE